MCLLAAAPNQGDTGRTGSIKLFKEDSASTANKVKHGYEIAVRKDNKMIGHSRKKIFSLVI